MIKNIYYCEYAIERNDVVQMVWKLRSLIFMKLKLKQCYIMKNNSIIQYRYITFILADFSYDSYVSMCEYIPKCMLLWSEYRDVYSIYNKHRPDLRSKFKVFSCVVFDVTFLINS